MDRLPLGDASIDLVVAHGIWNLARSAAEFRRAIAEAARVARPDAGLFVFTFSRAPRSPPTTSQSRASRSCSPSSRVNPSAS
jgi:ubiquinone/menaquinone biosynthesis C-methylase UbiE